MYRISLDEPIKLVEAVKPVEAVEPIKVEQVEPDEPINYKLIGLIIFGFIILRKKNKQYTNMQ